jgi:steroid delta-isomerase-like uncharacterized protein
MPNFVNLKETLDNFVQEVWNDGNIEASDNFVAAKYKIHHDPGDPWDGKELDLEGFKERVRLSRAPLPDQCFDIHEHFVECNRVVITWFSTATHGGDFPGFPASGKKLQMSGATVYYFDKDRIAGHWQITDRLGIFRQLTRAQ